jgi:N-acetylglucosamine-6-sulfatase
MPVRSRQSIALSGAALLAAACLGIAGPASGPGGPETAHAASPNRPNIILIRTDDQTLKQLNVDTMPKTMRLLAGQGTTFTDSIVTTPLCCPSRAAVLTGQYGHNNGVLSNNPGYPALKQKGNTLPVWLHRAGYRTAHVGKYLNHYSETARHPTDVAPGWDQWVTALDEEGPRYYDYSLSDNGRLVRYGQHDRDYVTRVLNRAAVRLIGAYTPGKRPLYLQLDQRAPHKSTGPSRGRCKHSLPQPDPRDIRRFAQLPLPTPPSFNEADVSDKPSFIRDRPQLDQAAIDRMRLTYQCALASLREVDRGTAAIYRALKSTGELGRSVIIFTSDNGFYYGEHRLRTGKAPPYEESIRVPLVIRIPSKYRRGARRIPKISEPVANLDLAPTILRLAHADPCRSNRRCRTMDGRSLLALLSGDTTRWPDDRGLLVELNQHAGRSAGVCTYQGVRAGDQIFTEYSEITDQATGACEPASERELYELGSDPYELDNLADTPAHRVEQLQLSNRLDQLRDCAGIAGRDHHVNGRPFCE